MKDVKLSIAVGLGRSRGRKKRGREGNEKGRVISSRKGRKGEGSTDEQSGRKTIA